MCGIILAAGPKYLSGGYMSTQLSHRGPDADTAGVNGNVFIAHRRLAIVDTTSLNAQQPRFKAQQYACVFNGELFNYKKLTCGSEIELISELLYAGHDLSQILNGYYAVAMHDISRNRITLARDIFGVMPLFYAKYEGSFFVASERKAMYALVPEDKIKPVPANTRIDYCLKTRKLTFTKYTQPWTFNLPGVIYGPYESHTAQVFLNAVREVAQHSDNGFSVALSGGLDSSLVLAACRGLGLTPTAILTTYIAETETEEMRSAKALVKHFKWEHLHKLIKLEEPDYDLRHWIETPPNPIRDFAYRRHAAVAKHSPSKVILCGEGADELGLGYPLNGEFNTPLARYMKKVSLLKSQATMTLDRVNTAGMQYSKEYRVPFLHIPFVQHALTVDQVGKTHFRKMATYLGIPDGILPNNKYSDEERIGRAQ
ncbi:asparagine synthetase B protein [Achromobacter phage Motura]|uniref:asparagine synthase (glutamine-hydrolyzing) n=1 Tax=Achromobacter phage Motura TaxID=2591403 RepID=A0A514CSI5_9CAUD|nr:asparagine synthetase B protein [Achromobacter phage Motura]QDH83433.1 asparagine synthetase B protein [Achromobacter phage Motura]